VSSPAVEYLSNIRCEKLKTVKWAISHLRGKLFKM
jgi:hypothetical protein